MNKEIKLFKLVSGDDIIGYFSKNSDIITLESPMKLIFRRSQSGSSAMFLLPWFPMELVENNMIDVNEKNVISMASPNEEFIKYYESIVNQEYERILQIEESIKEEFREVIESEDDQLEETAANLEELKNKLIRKYLH